VADFVQTGPFSRRSAEKIERLPGRIANALGLGNLGGMMQYLGSEKASKDYTNLLRGQLPNIGRSVRADQMFLPGTRNFPSGYKEDELAAGQRAENFRRGAGFVGQTPIVLGTRDGVTPDLTQSDTYKQYAATPSGQFERYFKTPEMDQYFGTASRGTAAPKDVAAMQALAGQAVAPGKTSEELSAFYRAQSAMGRAQMPEIQKGLGYAEGSDMAKWAAANPMLAQRLYAKEMSKREAAGQVTPNTTYAGSKIGGEDFAMVANAVPAPWNQQGAMVDENRGIANLQPEQAKFTTGEGMPAFPTTGEKAAQLLSDPQFARLLRK